jgi:hypothetical protein
MRNEEFDLIAEKLYPNYKTMLEKTKEYHCHKIIEINLQKQYDKDGNSGISIVTNYSSTNLPRYS